MSSLNLCFLSHRLFNMSSNYVGSKVYTQNMTIISIPPSQKKRSLSLALIVHTFSYLYTAPLIQYFLFGAQQPLIGFCFREFLLHILIAEVFIDVYKTLYKLITQFLFAHMSCCSSLIPSESQRNRGSSLVTHSRHTSDSGVLHLLFLLSGNLFPLSLHMAHVDISKSLLKY